MKIIKYSLFFIICTMAIFLTSCSCSKKNFKYQLRYKLEYGEYYEIIGIGGLDNESVIEIPTEYKKIPVLALGRQCFKGCSNIQKIIIPDTIKYIENGAFMDCAGLTGVEIPDTVKALGESIFSGCTNLVNFKLPSHITEIPAGTFQECSNLKRVTIKEGITSIGIGTFEDCTSLEEIVLPNSLENIGYLAFRNCSKLTSINIPKNVKSLGTRAFENCINLETVYINSIITDSFRDVFSGCEKLQYNRYENGLYLGSVTNPYFVLITLEDKTVDRFVLHLDTIYIYTGAFFQCNNIDRYILNDNLEYMDFNFGSPYWLNNYENGYYIGTQTNPYLVFVGVINKMVNTINIHPDTKFIASRAFANCDRLLEVNIPNGVKQIGFSAFHNCVMLNKVYIPISVKYIESQIFSECKNVHAYCEIESMPSGWQTDWANGYNGTTNITWGYKEDK